MPVRIVIADDHPIVRHGLRAALSAQPGLEVVGEAGDGEEAVARALALRPDVVLMDLVMPRLNGVEATRRIVAQGGRARVIALSVHTERPFVEEALRGGARGYVVKSASFDELVAAVVAVSRGQTFVSPAVAEVLVDGLREAGGGADEPRAQLTARERQVLQLVAEGLHTKEVAARLGISDKTVHAFRLRVMEKLGLSSVADLTKYALRHGLTTLT